MSEAAPIKVMIVDDVPAIRQGITQSLEAAGFKVSATARNGQEAIDQSAEEDFDIILLDVIMPVLQGVEALPEVRKNQPNAIIVMLTSTSERDLVLRCRKNGANAYIIKNDDMLSILGQRLQDIWDARSKT